MEKYVITALNEIVSLADMLYHMELIANEVLILRYGHTLLHFKYGNKLNCVSLVDVLDYMKINYKLGHQFCKCGRIN